MNIFAYIVMFVWPMVVVALFATIPVRRAVIAAFLVAWLFLPMASFSLPLFPDYTKMSAACLGVFLGVMLFDSDRLCRFRPSWIDVPMALFCASPFLSSITNELGVYDAASGLFRQTVIFGMPYFIGRLYFTDAESLKELAVGVFIGGLIYVPFCLFEIRMSPQLHNIVYGWSQSSFVQTQRWGGSRPVVFMDDGLMLAVWMTAASVVGVWLCFSRTLRRIYGIPVVPLMVALLATTVLCRSTGAWVLLAGGLASLFSAHYLNTKLAMVLLLFITPAYIAVRATGIWDAAGPVDFVRAYVSEARAESLAGRIKNENILAEKARKQPCFGWGGWGRNRVYDDYGNDISVTDGLWIIEFGNHGLLGLSSLFMALLLPPTLVVARLAPRDWSTAQFAPMTSLAVVLALYAFDCIPNGMVNPIYMLCGGALASCVTHGLEHAALPNKIRPGGNSVSASARRLWPCETRVYHTDCGDNVNSVASSSVNVLPTHAE